MPLEEILRKFENVFAPLAKRRHDNLDAVQPVEQIEPEAAALDEIRQRVIRRRDDPGVDLPRAGPADTLDRHFLDGAQQLGLRRRGEIRDLVEKQRAAMRVLEFAAPRSHARRDAILDPEQLRLEQRLDDRRAVDRDEGTLAARGQIVNLLRDELLPYAALPFDQALLEHSRWHCRRTSRARIAYGADSDGVSVSPTNA
jgi:hypothetical protein